jgi:hypothetical protein
MLLSLLNRSAPSRHAGRRSSARPIRFRPRLEALEDRLAPANFTVSRTDDAGAGSLRQAIIDLNNSNDPMNTIDATGVRGTIDLQTELPRIANPVTINGPGRTNLTVERDPMAAMNFRIFQVLVAGKVDFSGLTINRGRAGAGNGGGIWVQGGDVGIVNSAVTSCWAASGGGIYVSVGTFRMIGNSIVDDNLVDNNGGGIYAAGLAAQVIIQGGTTPQTACYITNNNVSGAGGGIYFTLPPGAGGGLFVQNTTISGNRVISDGNGAGIYAQAPQAAGAPAPVQIIQSLIQGNSVMGAGKGGGLYNNGGAYLSNATISGNTAELGGGILHALAPANVTRLVNCTVTANTSRAGTGAALQAGGIDNQSAGTSSNAGAGTSGTGGVGTDSGIILGNTIVAGNVAPAYPDVAGSLTSLGHNLIGNGDGASGFLPSDLVGTTSAPLDPKLGSLADNGGPTQTYLLLAGSPALAAGDTSLVDSATDQRGYARIVNGAVDIGAVEMQPDELS